MTKKKDVTENLPFSELKSLLKKAGRSDDLFVKGKVGKKREAKPKNASVGEQKFEHIIKESAIAEDSDLFSKAVTDVVPFESQNYSPKIKIITEKKVVKHENSDKKVLENLDELVTSGIGFAVAVADTPKYMEGTGYNVNPILTKRLHQGDFSIQDHLDLHGNTVAEAQILFDNFLREAISSGKRAVLIIHGRGLSSPGEPVLKKKVSDWLSSGQWRKWTVSFASARPEDGGAGATYVLLRSKPLVKVTK